LSCIIDDALGRWWLNRAGSAPAQTERVSMSSAEYHRKMAAEYSRLANIATTEQERCNYLRLEQEELLLANPDAFVWQV
jgi:hypothetical protein